MLDLLFSFMFFFFKQKTAYEMRISDWSSDVCSSDLREVVVEVRGGDAPGGDEGEIAEGCGQRAKRRGAAGCLRGEELHGGDTGIQSRLDLGRGDGTGQDGDAVVAAPVDHRAARSGGDHEGRTGGDGPADLVGAEDGSRADEHQTGRTSGRERVCPYV